MNNVNWIDEFDALSELKAKGEFIDYCRHDVAMGKKSYEEQLALYGYRKVEDVSIAKVIFNKPATIVIWSDGVKTVVKAQKGDKFDPEKGLAMAIAKRALGNTGAFNNEFKKWIK